MFWAISRRHWGIIFIPCCRVSDRRGTAIGIKKIGTKKRGTMTSPQKSFQDVGHLFVVCRLRTAGHIHYVTKCGKAFIATSILYSMVDSSVVNVITTISHARSHKWMLEVLWTPDRNCTEGKALTSALLLHFYLPQESSCLKRQIKCKSLDKSGSIIIS